MYEEEQINYEFDYDEEKKGVRRTVGKVCICIGILLVLFVSNLFIKDMKVVINGTKVTATLENREGNYVALYKENGRSHAYDLGGYINKFHRKTVSIYYTEDPADGIFVNWGLYFISYFGYMFVIFYGIISFNDIGLIEFFKRLFEKKEKTQDEEKEI